MTAQIEQSPRQGVELDQAWTWKDYAEMSACYALVGALAVLVTWPKPEVIFAVTLFAAAVLIVSLILNAALSPGAHL